MVNEKFIFEGIVEELQRVERVRDGGKTEKFKAKIQSRGDDQDQVITIVSSEPINLLEGEVVQITALQVQKSLTDDYAPKINNGIEE
jgi:hypothetical protein